MSANQGGPGARERMLGRLRAAAPVPTTPASTQLAALEARIDGHFEGRRKRLASSATGATGLPAANHAATTMRDALINLHAEAWCASEAGWPASLAERIAQDLGRDHARQTPARLLLDCGSAEGRALAGALAALSVAVVPVGFDRPINAWKPELFDTIDAGFTVARSGIASTGTLIIEPSPSAPRTVSLLPPLHIALVYADTLHADLHAAVKSERWCDGMPTNLVLISGPSKTTDIQLTLAYGAHGPKRVWVVIVERERHNAAGGVDAALGPQGDYA